MRIPVFAFIVPVIGLLIDWYIYRAMKRAGARRGLIVAHLVLAALCLADIITVFAMPKSVKSNHLLLALFWCYFTYATIYGSKLVFVIFDWLGRVFGRKKNRRKYRARPRGLGRMHPMTKIGIFGAIVVFVTMWWGALINRFNIQVKEVTVEVPNLPRAFEGYRIAQISDLHVGTWMQDTTFLHNAVEQINGLHPDLIVFTGDLVNRQANELVPFKPVLQRLHAKQGVYSVLGNHDYDDYMRWPDTLDAIRDRQWLLSMQRQMGWKLLNNQHDTLRRGNDRMLIVGVENLGDPPFKVYGDLKAAYPTTGDPEIKILLSHTPAHWTDSIANNPAHNIALTLSGHTHAMQIEAFGISPARLRYRHWGGLYTDTLGQQLYVNYGLGTVGMPMRIGATPEITILTLKRKPTHKK